MTNKINEIIDGIKSISGIENARLGEFQKNKNNCTILVFPETHYPVNGESYYFKVTLSSLISKIKTQLKKHGVKFEFISKPKPCYVQHNLEKIRFGYSQNWYEIKILT